MPIAGSSVSVLGRPYRTTGVGGTGLMIVTVEDIVYNPGTTHILDESSSGANASPKCPRVRKRKRNSDDSDGTFDLLGTRHY